MYYKGYSDISVLEIAFNEGRAKGLSAYLVRNGQMECVIVKDHALDIAQASYAGTGVSFISRNGLNFHKNDFAKSFEGGLLYTCGYDSISNCVEGVYTHGTLHGTAAENVRYEVKDGKVYVRGDVATTGLFCDSLVLHREICVSKEGVVVNDSIENTRGVDASYCLLYHCNFGAPFLAKGGEVKIDYLTREGLTPLACENESTAAQITEPIPNAEEVVYYHTVKTPCARYENKALGLAVNITYDAEKLPVLLEWKSMAEDDYALGLEPATTRFDTFEKTSIAAHETHTYSLNIAFEKTDPAEDVKYVDLVTNGTANYKIVYTDFYNNLNRHSDTRWPETAQGFTQSRAIYLAQWLGSLTGAEFTCIPEKEWSGEEKAIVVGKQNGGTDTYFDYYENGVHLKDENVYLYGHNHRGINDTVNNFIASVKKRDPKTYSIVCDKNGCKWNDFTLKYDIPLPEGLEYEGAYTATNNGMYFVYENCENEAFYKYCSELISDGFEEYYSREADKNLFAGYRKGTQAAWVYYIASRKEMRVAFEKYQPLPELRSDDKKVQEPYVIQIGVSYTDGNKHRGAGMGYIIGLEDGRYIVIDGGCSPNTQALTKEYYDFLVNNNKREDGKVIIAAWILTHAHYDHYQTIETFGKLYASQVECKYFIHNLPTELTLWGAANNDLSYIRNRANVERMFKGAVTYTVRTGYATEVGGLFLEFMSTYEDLYNNNDLKVYNTDKFMPNSVDEFNDTTCTFRFTFNKGDSDEAKMFFLGDAYFDHGERLASMWSADYMKTEVVQIAHHSWQNGVTSGHVDMMEKKDVPPRSTCYSKIRPAYGFYSNYSAHIPRGGKKVLTLLKAYNAQFSEDNVYCNDYDGIATDSKMTFDGGIKVTKTSKED